MVATFDAKQHVSRGSAGGGHLGALYAAMKPADFRGDVLQRAQCLGVVEMVGSGWSDWGTPERVLATLEASGEGRALLARCASGSAQSGAGMGYEPWSRAAAAALGAQRA